MNQGIRTVIYPVKDIAQAMALFSKLLGVAPYADAAYYGFRVGDQKIGLDPNGHKHGMTAYYHVDDIKKSLQLLLDTGGQVQQEIKNVGRIADCIRKGTLMATSSGLFTHLNRVTNQCARA